ncbi:Spy0128 family protein, partial [Bilifractor sp. LCP19S3_H10]|uniref:Spy0128 family protein n=1 Tax=Bilifractor sp. LCP19S3_H10 TaxID=3438736 RepID=UPI003F92F249
LADLDGNKSRDFHYTITEGGKVTGVTNDEDKVLNVTVAVTNDGGDKLSVVATYDDNDHTFTNTYNADGETEITGTKYIEGRDFQSGDSFTFTVTADDRNPDAPLPEHSTVTINPTSGTSATLDFGKIKYTLADLGDQGNRSKTFYYNVAETGKGTGLTFAGSKTFSVTVTETGTEKLSVSNDLDKNPLSFKNTYNANGKIQLDVIKKLENREFQKGDNWTFTLAGKDTDYTDPMPEGKGNVITADATSGSSKTYQFGTINYKLADLDGNKSRDFHYTITEGGKVTGVTNDEDKVLNVTVTVTKNGGENLSVVATYDNNDHTFTNTYSAYGKVQFKGTKNITNKPEKMSLAGYTFNVVNNDTGDIVGSASSDTNGNIEYPEINYTQDDAGKKYTYTVSEVNAGQTIGGVKYDSKSYTVTVKIKDKGDGTLEVEASKNSKKLNFTNTYQAQAASAVISGTKTLNGVPASVAGQFRFDLFDANGNRIDTAANDEKGNFIFGKLHFEKAGDYTYTIKEQNAGEIIDGIKYPDEERTVTITVKDDGKGKLVANNATVTAFDNKQFAKVTVRKDWDDAGNESYRPSTVVIDLIDTNTGATVQKLELSEVNNWQGTFDQLEAGKSYTVHEEENDEFYKALNNDQVVTADVNGTLVALTNKFIHKPVTVYANKVLNGGTLTNGEFMFALYRNSDPEKVYRTAVNNAAGEIFFTDVEFDEKGYTVREIQGSDASVAYDSDAIVYDAEGNVTSSSHAVFTNTVRPIVLRVQKRSRIAPYDPLLGATYGLYEVVKGDNDILIESQVSDENGYMYFGKIQPSTDGNTHIYYFKEIAAPEGHEVDPYIGQKFQVRYTGNGEIALFSEDGQTPVTIGDITSQNAENLLVQHTSAKTTLDTTGALTYSDSKITATAQAADGAFEAGTTMKVEPLTGSELKDAQNKVEIACGKIASNVVYYNVEFVDKNGTVVEPKFGDVTVTIQYKDSLALPEGTDAKALKIVHLKEKSDGTEVQAVAGSIAANSDKLLQASFTSDSFSKFGIVEPSADNSSLNSNYLVTAAGVSDQVSRLNIAKLDTSGKYLKGARLQIIEKATGRVMADWTTTDGPETFARWFDEAQTKSMNVDTYYILHEVSAPDGYQLADDILFRINKYDSSITIYKLDENGNLVADQEAIDKWVSDNTLDMIDVPVEYQTKKTRMQKTVKYEKVIQGKDKVVYVTNAKAVKTGDVSNLAMYILLFAAAGAVLIVLFFRRRDQRAHKS